MKTTDLFKRGIINAKVKFLLTSLLLCTSAFTRSQAQSTSGGALVIGPGAVITSTNDLSIQSSASLDVQGTLILKKNLSNQNATANSIGNGLIELSGTTAQTISGQNIIANLTMNNAEGLTVAGNTRLTGTLTLSAGLITLGSNNLTLGPSATFSGTPSATNMIVSTGTGELRKEFSAASSFTFPVGDDTGTPEYSPVILNFISGTFVAGNYAAVTLKNEKHPDSNITGNYLNRYWNITQSGITGFSCNATFQYLLADVNGTESKLSCTRVDPLPWVTYAMTNASAHVLSASGIVSFGAFTGLKSETTPSNQELVNITIPNEVTNCYDATEILTVAGNDASFLVESGGNVTLVAGNKILLLPGVKVNSGGFLHGTIATSNNYCGSLPGNPLVENAKNDEVVQLTIPEKNQFIKIYPNPTTDIVFVELLESGETGVVNITVYNMKGGILLQKTTNGESKFQFSLADKPVGIYMVYVQSGERYEVAKVIRN